MKLKIKLPVQADGAEWAHFAEIADEMAYAAEFLRDEPAEVPDPTKPSRTFDRTLIDRCWFYPAIVADKAAKLGVRGVALVRHIVFHICRRSRLGTSKLDKFGLEKAYEWDTLANFGAAVGLEERQARRLLNRAVELKLLRVEQTRYGVKVFIVERGLILTVDEERVQLRHYHRELAAKVGVTESILFLLIQSRDNGLYVSFDPDTTQNWLLRFLPWLTAASLQTALWKLVNSGWLKWDYHAASIGMRRYFAIKKFKVKTLSGKKH